MPSLFRLALRPDERRSTPEPVPVSLRPVALVGIAGWLVALVVTLVLWFSDSVAATTVWTCVVGVLLGGYGLWWVGRRPGR
ncbi:hypothetical protein AGMMS50218_15910 [Actinomycetota bacterium]|nr:hypothetical protein AGMMS50218_15910 [Actinomycetota bacterium]